MSIQKKGSCIFDTVYKSQVKNDIWQKRTEAGIFLADHFGIDGDSVVGIPQSAIPIAEGYSQRSGIKLSKAIVKNPDFGRSADEVTQEKRVFVAQNKFLYNPDEIEGKDIVLCDDAVVRGTVSKAVIDRLKQFGVKDINFISGSSPVLRACDYMGVQSESELLAVRKNMEEIREYLGVKSFNYMPYDMSLQIYGQQGKQTCSECFKGAEKE